MTRATTTQHVCNSVCVLDGPGARPPGEVALELHGELDHACHVAVEHILAVVWDLRPSRLTLDLAGVGYLNARGLRVLAQAGRAVRDRGCEFELTCPPGVTARLLGVVGFGHVVTGPAAGGRSGDLVFAPPVQASALAGNGTGVDVRVAPADLRLTALLELERVLGGAGGGRDVVRDVLLAQVVRSVPGAEGGSIAEAEPRTAPGTWTSSDGVAAVVHHAQADNDQGPSRDAQRTGEDVLVEDITIDDRWPAFRDAVSDVPVRSVLCLPLTSAGRVVGVLTVHSGLPHAFSAWERVSAADLATRGAGALQEAHLRDGLQKALASRDLIGQAKGILMARHRMTAEQAFDLLSRTSQRHNVKVAVLAEDLARTGVLAD